MNPSDHPASAESRPPAVTHNVPLQRFEIPGDGGEPAILSYVFEGGNVVFDHTHVPEHLRGRGLAAVLTKFALEEARRRRWMVVPRCSYVAAFIERNPGLAASDARMECDRLFLIKPDFPSEGRSFFCPGCAEVLGLLEYYPALKSGIEVCFVDFERPRPELVALLGEENQSCPVLVLASEPSGEVPPDVVSRANGRAFVEGARGIARYLSAEYGTGDPF